MVNPSSESGESGSRKHTLRAVGVVAVSIAVYLLLILYNIAPYDYNPSCMIRFGVENAYFYPVALEPNLVVFSDPDSGGVGYDGQFYYYIVKDFFMGEWTVPNPFRAQRILYPLLSYVLAFGRADLLPYSMPAVNLLAIALSAMLLWKMAGGGQARAEALAVYTLNIGFLVAVFFCAATPLCVALAVAGVYFHSRKKIWAASLALALGMLAQENVALVAGTLCLWLAWERNLRGAFVVALSILPWTIWQGVLWSKYGTPPVLMSAGHFTLPFFGMISQTASLSLPGGFIGNLRELNVFPFMGFVLALLAVGVWEMKKKPSFLNLLLVMHALAGVCFNSEQIWGSTITSPARALATIFPFVFLYHAREKSMGSRLLIAICVLLTLMGIFRILFLPVHPFFLMP